MKSALILLASIATSLAYTDFDKIEPSLGGNEFRPSGLRVEYISVPETCDVKAMSGNFVVVHYTGKLVDETKGCETKFESDRREIFQVLQVKSQFPNDFLQVGEEGGPARALKGMEEGVLGMCIGEKRKLIVPYWLGYGRSDYKENRNEWGCMGVKCLDGSSIVPGYSTLYYDIELIEAKPDSYTIMNDHYHDLLKSMDINADLAVSKEEMSIHLNEVYKSNQGNLLKGIDNKTVGR